MSLIELFILSVGLSMDAFAVSVCKGLSMRQLNWNHAVIIGLYFGGFQAAMPLFGYVLGYQFREVITSIDHWIAFILLSVIGVNMMREAFDNSEEENLDAGIGFQSMVILSVATSIDALAVGVTFAFLEVHIFSAISFIGIVTLLLSIAGVKVGNRFGAKYKSKSELAGGLILILIGLNILTEHVFL